jgi:hypothetical protein
VIAALEMSAWAACWAVSAITCSAPAGPTNGRRAQTRAPGATAGRHRGRATAPQLLGPVRDLRVVLQQAAQRLPIQHREAGHPVAGACLIPSSSPQGRRR